MAQQASLPVSSQSALKAESATNNHHADHRALKHEGATNNHRLSIASELGAVRRHVTKKAQEAQTSANG